MLFDTLGLIYVYRQKWESGIKKDEYIRVCFSWVLFLTLYNIFSCNWAGFFGTLIRLIIFGAKACVTIPLFKGTLKIHKYLIEDKKGEEYWNKLVTMIQSKLCKCNVNSSSASYSETTEPESTPDNGNFNQ